MVVTIYSGAQWAPGEPNQRDHIEFSNAVAAAYDSLADPPRWLFECGPDITHGEVVDGHVEAAVASLMAHAVYLSVLDPDTPVEEQARNRGRRCDASATGVRRPAHGVVHSAKGGDVTPVVATRAGKVRGAARDGVQVFRGIPYAQPPVGPLRFAAPVPHDEWAGVRDAVEFGPPPPQPDRVTSTDEWLTVNVWTPEHLHRAPD